MNHIPRSSFRVPHFPFLVVSFYQDADGGLIQGLYLKIPGDNSMRKLIMLAAMLFIAAIPARAQGNYPVAEIFGGYSYLSFDTGGVSNGDIEDFFDNREGFHGVGFSVAGNFSKHFGIVGDFSYHRKSADLGFTALHT